MRDAANRAARAGLVVEENGFSFPTAGPARAEWDALAQRAAASPYLTWGWLKSWAETYAPSRLRLLRILHHDRGLVALGLTEECRFGVLRFAGAPVTPVRGLLCEPGDEEPAWRALREWLRDRPHWSLVDGVASGACAPPDTMLSDVPWFEIDLPHSFDEFLQSRSAARRREFRRRLRVAVREGVRTRELLGSASRSGLDVFARLHTARALTKGQVHRVIDDRLIRMLGRVADRATPELRVFVVEQDERPIGVGVQLDHGGVTWAYNTGFEPSAARLSPGLLVRLASIEDSIGRGIQRLDLGPGDFGYKRDFGGRRFNRVKVDVTNRSLAGELVRARIRGEQQLRESELLRRAVLRWRAARRTWHGRRAPV